jgi:cytochrome c
MRINTVILASVLGFTVVTATASAQEAAGQPAASGAPLSGDELYKQRTCIACHGPDAKTPILPMYPKLAGQNPQYLLQQARDIKSGARANGSTAAMKGVMHLVSDEELQTITTWLGTLK